MKKSAGKVALACRDEPELLKDWVKALDEANNREDLPEHYAKLNGAGIIYRGSNTIHSVQKVYEHLSRDELRSTLRSMKKYETGSCDESCEVYNV